MQVPERVRVLYVEDNEEAGLMLGILLGQSGVDISTARNIEDAVCEAGSNKFDAYLLGSGFADGSGISLCRQLVDLNPHIPVIFYSGDARPADKKRGMEAGASAYLVKPEVDTILPTLRRLVINVG